MLIPKGGKKQSTKPLFLKSAKNLIKHLLWIMFFVKAQKKPQKTQDCKLSNSGKFVTLLSVLNTY